MEDRARKSPAEPILRRIRTYRHFRVSQLLGRLVAGARRTLGLTRIPPAPEEPTGGLEPRCEFLHLDPWNDADGLRRGRVTFLGRTRRMGDRWDWEAADMPLLWRFHLHYFDYLHLLRPDERASLAGQWIEENPPTRGPGWHPYPTSRRISKWCQLFGKSAPADLQESLYRQASYLRRNLETYLSGNHVLENARALVLAGLYFGDEGQASEWTEDGLRLLRHELAEQILPDGGHYERSPMYHAQVLAGCLDLLNVLPRGSEASGVLRETAERMLRFLQAAAHPDGEIALFNDATLDGAPSPRRLSEYAAEIGGMAAEEDFTREAAPSLLPFQDTGFFRYHGGTFTLMLDGGPIGPHHQPGHAHADIFSYELSVGGDRFVTDSGVYEYRSGEMRRYCRSTEGHSTLEVDGLDQAEMWGSFRVARRFDPVVRQARVEDGTFLFSGSFDGYATLIGDGVVHYRTLECNDSAGVLRVQDRVDGRGQHELRSRIHLHPDVEVVELAGGLLLRKGDTAVRLTSSIPLSLATGWYCPCFGTRVERDVVILGGNMELPARLEYELAIATDSRQ